MSATIADFMSWLDELVSRRGNATQKVQVLCNELVLPQNTVVQAGISADDLPAELKARCTRVLKVAIYTKHHQYTLVVNYHPKTISWLMASAVNRYSRAGEDWQRGSDLADGPLCRETWNRIMMDILSYELVQLSDTVLDESNRRRYQISIQPPVMATDAVSVSSEVN